MQGFLLSLVLFFACLNLSAQNVLNGVILDQSSQKGIPFCNIGITNTSVGTISNEDGTYRIIIPIKYQTDSLTVSALGYKTRTIPVYQLRGRSTKVYLTEKATQLSELIVFAKHEKPKTFSLGNRLSRGGSMLLVDSTAAGSAIALLIENKFPAYSADLHFPVFVESAQLRIYKNTLNEFKVRIRLLEIDSLTQLPGKDLFEQSVVVTSNIKSGWLRIDLSDYRWKITQPAFFLVFEWIMDDKDRLETSRQFTNYRKLNPQKVTHDTTVLRGEKVGYLNYHGAYFGANFAVSTDLFSLNNYKTYTRTNSLGAWTKSPGILTARINVTNQPKDILGKTNPTAKPDNNSPCQDPPSICSAINLCESFLEETSINGAQLSVSVRGTVVLSKGFGVSDVDAGTKVDIETQFRIGSVSKSLTSAALIKLVSAHKLDLDAPVQKYVRSYPEKKYNLTTRQLAGHQGGIRHYSDTSARELFSTRHYVNSTESIKLFQSDSLLFPPGAQYHYSSYGWNLVGAIIEGISGNSYARYMSEQMWKPLAMNHTCPDVRDSVISHKSKFYLLSGEECPSYDLSYKFPSGGLLSTTDDLVKFGNELLNGRYLDPHAKNALFISQVTTQNQDTHYGLGWNIGKDENGHRIYFHAGNLLEGSAYLILYPDDNIVVAFLANSQEGINFKIQKIGELFYKK